MADGEQLRGEQLADELRLASGIALFATHLTLPFLTMCIAFPRHVRRCCRQRTVAFLSALDTAMVLLHDVV